MTGVYEKIYSCGFKLNLTLDGHSESWELRLSQKDENTAGSQNAQSNVLSDNHLTELKNNYKNSFKIFPQVSEPDASSKRSSLRSHQGAAAAAGALGVLEERGDSAPAPHQVMMMVVMVMCTQLCFPLKYLNIFWL